MDKVFLLDEVNDFIHSCSISERTILTCLFIFALMYTDMLYLILCYVEPSGSEWCLRMYRQQNKTKVSDSIESRGEMSLSQSEKQAMPWEFISIGTFSNVPIGYWRSIKQSISMCVCVRACSIWCKRAVSCLTLMPNDLDAFDSRWDLLCMIFPARVRRSLDVS